MSATVEAIWLTIIALVSAVIVAMTLVVVMDHVKREYNPSDGEMRLMHDWPFAENN